MTVLIHDRLNALVLAILIAEILLLLIYLLEAVNHFTERPTQSVVPFQIAGNGHMYNLTKKTTKSR